jgi:ADP-ribose pyrophosphatase
MAKAERVKDAAEILRRRYIGDDPEKRVALERERLNADVAHLLYDLRNDAGLSQNELADLSKPDAVVIVPTLNTPEGKKIVILREYRLPIRDNELSFPAGLIDPGETTEEAAIRELKEETGLICDKIQWVSPILFSSSGMTDESVQYVFMEVSGEVDNKNNENDEEIEVLVLSPDEINKLAFDRVSKWGAKTWPILMWMIN